MKALMVAWIWLEMCGSGAGIGMRVIITRIAQIKIHLGLRMACAVLCVAVAGSMTALIAGAFSVATVAPPFATTISVFALPGLFNPFPLYAVTTFGKILFCLHEIRVSEVVNAPTRTQRRVGVRHFEPGVNYRPIPSGHFSSPKMAPKIFQFKLDEQSGALD